MTISRVSARKWCNDSEFALVEASFGDTGIQWTPALLRAKIERTRRLRDKNRDRLRQIKRGNRAASGSKTGVQVTAAAVAEKRTQIFDEALARFTARLAKLDALRQVKALKTAVAAAVARKRATPSPSAGRGALVPLAPARPGAAFAAPRAAQLRRTNQMARVRSRNARNQAKRDGRG
jgi:hypothetical protein